MIVGGGGNHSEEQMFGQGGLAELRAELAAAAAATSLPAEPDAAAVEALVIDLHRRALGDARFNLAGG